MKKILLPFEGSHFPRHLLDFASQLNDRSPLLVTAAFIPELDYAGLWAVPGGVASQASLACAGDDQTLLKNNGARLQRYCEEKNMKFRIHEDHNDFSLNAIRKETRFADMMMVGSKHFFEEFDNRQPNRYMKELLHHSECPVLLAPDIPTLPGELIFAYDGSPDSVFAIKQFIYLFPEFSRLQATLVYMDVDAIGGIPDEGWIKELCSHRFRKFRALRLNMHTDQFFDTWLGMLTSPWLIAGSYGRPEPSGLLHKSFIARAIEAHNMPIFLAHC